MEVSSWATVIGMSSECAGSNRLRICRRIKPSRSSLVRFGREERLLLKPLAEITYQSDVLVSQRRNRARKPDGVLRIDLERRPEWRTPHADVNDLQQRQQGAFEDVRDRVTDRVRSTGKLGVNKTTAVPQMHFD
jgi:hypothetical protein